MKLSKLPWFIKKEIIDLVIENNPKYCSVNKEWLERMIVSNGRLSYGNMRPTKEALSAYSRFIRKVYFYRISDIYWDTLYSYMAINHVTITVTSESSATDVHKFINRLLLLPPLKIIVVRIFGQTSLDFTQLLNQNLNCLKELSSPAEQFITYKGIQNVIFSNLTTLYLSNVIHTLEFHDLVKSMPKLTRVWLESYKEVQVPLCLTNIIVPNRTELVCKLLNRRGNTIALNLKKLPVLKILCTVWYVEFTDLNSFDNLEELTLGGSNEYLTGIVSSNFPKLRRLGLNFLEQPDSTIIPKILQLCTSLTTLELSINNTYEFSKNLPTLPYTVTELYLDGLFHLTPNLLQWLSDIFKLKLFQLREGYLEETNSLPTVPFKYLRSLTILNRHQIDEFKDNFNREIYPHVDSITVEEYYNFKNTPKLEAICFQK